MGFHGRGAAASQEPTCHYGQSKLAFRGPQRMLNEPYLAFLGGSETYGMFIDRPFVDLVEAAAGRVCVNLGAVNAGLDAILNDPGAMQVAKGADLTVVQILGAQNLSNRFYRVHPRRNDRFLAPAEALSKLYDDFDFTEFDFTKHMLGALARCPERFAFVRAELQAAWLARMRRLADVLAGRVLMLWLRYDAVDDAAFHAKPALVTREMMEQLRPDTLGIIEVPVTTAGRSCTLERMRYRPLQRPAAKQMIGPDMHARIAERLTRELERVT